MNNTSPTSHYEKNKANKTWYLTDPRLREEFFFMSNAPGAQNINNEESSQPTLDLTSPKKLATIRNKSSNSIKGTTQLETGLVLKRSSRNSARTQQQVQLKPTTPRAKRKYQRKAQNNATISPDQPLFDSVLSPDPGKVGSCITTDNNKNEASVISTLTKKKPRKEYKPMDKKKPLDLNREEEVEDSPRDASLVEEDNEQVISPRRPTARTFFGKHVTEEPQEERQLRRVGGQERGKNLRQRNDRPKNETQNKEEMKSATTPELELTPEEMNFIADRELEAVMAPEETVARPLRRTRSQYSSRTDSVYQMTKMDKSEKSSAHSSTSFVGREVVFVDPRDKNEKFWWPAMIVPHGEVDESMGFDELGPNEVIVKYFEDCTYSAVPLKEIKRFDVHHDPFLKYKTKYGKEFLHHIGVRNACNCLANGEPDPEFKWDYWMRPAELVNPSARNVYNTLIISDEIDLPVMTRKSMRARKGKEGADYDMDGISEAKPLRSRKKVVAPRKIGSSVLMILDEEVKVEAEEVILKSTKHPRKANSRKQSISSNKSTELFPEFLSETIYEKSSLEDVSLKKKTLVSQRHVFPQSSEEIDESVVDIEGISPVDTGNPVLEKSFSTKKQTGKRPRELFSDQSNDEGSQVRKAPNLRKGKTFKKSRSKKQNISVESYTSPRIEDSEMLSRTSKVNDVPARKPKMGTKRLRTPEPHILTYNELSEISRRNIDRFDFADLAPEEKEPLYQQGFKSLDLLGQRYRQIVKTKEELEKKLNKKKADKRRSQKLQERANQNKPSNPLDKEQEEISPEEDSDRHYEDEEQEDVKIKEDGEEEKACSGIN
ncbi:hypothetical protein G9A89_012938 [Geosiphon pyriformis]|nr:hypothetical protein G9A89_012938 [Geosiphon pyriformis]